MKKDPRPSLVSKCEKFDPQLESSLILPFIFDLDVQFKNWFGFFLFKSMQRGEYKQYTLFFDLRGHKCEELLFIYHVFGLK